MTPLLRARFPRGLRAHAKDAAPAMSEPRTSRLRARFATAPGTTLSLLRRPIVAATLGIVAAAGTVVAVADSQTGSSHSTIAAIDTNRDPGSAPTSVANHGPALPNVAPLRQRIAPDVLIVSSQVITPAQVRAIQRATGATSALLVAVGRVALGGGTTQAMGVDPSTFRAFAPRGTAESTPLWQSVAGGDIAVAHTVAQALKVQLGGETFVGEGLHRQILRVGAFATTGLPGVGLVVDQSFDDRLGLIGSSGLIISDPGTDPIIAAALARRVLPGATVTSLRVPVAAGGRLQWVPPCIGPISTPFGPTNRGFHPGIDIAAGYGAPIYAAADGQILYAGPASGFGQEVIIQHLNGVITVYGHMERILVTEGSVAAGEAIALVGSEGISTGPHLHFEVHVDDHLVDPLVWLEAHGVRVLH